MPEENARSAASSFALTMQAIQVRGFLLALAVTPVISNTGFLLHTRRSKDSPQKIEPEVESLLRSSFYAAEPTVVSLPRWKGNLSSPELAAVVNVQLLHEASNVISVDLEEAISEADVLAEVANLLILLNQSLDVPLDNILLVGFAEGAHLAGGAAAKLRTFLGRQFSRVTALDPSPVENVHHVLSPLDAEFVEVIHTNAGDAGTWETLGHVDYYPNGGAEQPGCSDAICSHERAFVLLSEMWAPTNDFVSALCPSVESMNAQNCRWSNLKMGQREERPTKSGVYFLATNQFSPYGKGAYHINFL